MFGLTPEKLLIIAVIAAFLIGPERLPLYAAKFSQFIRSMRDTANGAKARMKEEMGPEFDDVDWKKLDPRQYDPRRIVREALMDNTPAPSAIKPVTQSAYMKSADALPAGSVPPFDAEST
ncbi:Sec-independent protein translocase TatB [Leifsonia sp. McL0607]|uniref:Sec-independent protein translocase TatB n=1 Tax=Leifsonia sp. McL0607 TaxID=3415672 RepID=UPI003CF451CB